MSSLFGGILEKLAAFNVTHTLFEHAGVMTSEEHVKVANELNVKADLAKNLYVVTVRECF